MAGTPTSNVIDFKPIDASLPERHDKVKPSTDRHKKSRFDEPIRRDDEGPHGQSRNVGDIDAKTRHIVISILIDEAVRRGHSLRDIAYLLLIARLESGFNPDAASPRSSASGVMQITDVTADDIAEVTSKPAWIQANPRDAKIDIINSASRFSARKNIIAGIIQFERAKAKSLAWAQNHSASGAEARLYQYYHYGLYLKDAREDQVGLSEYSTHIAPMIDQVEAALKTQARFQVQLKQPDGRGYANALFAAIVPKKNANTVTPAPISEQHGVPRLFADFWAQLQARWHSGPAPRPTAIYARAPIAAIKKAEAFALTASQTNRTAIPAPSTHTSAVESPEKKPEALSKEPDANSCVTYPLRVQDALETEVVFGKTDGQGFTPIFTLGSIGEVQFFVLDDEYLIKAQRTSGSSPANTNGISEEAHSATTSISTQESNREANGIGVDQEGPGIQENSPGTPPPTAEEPSSTSGDTSPSKMETIVNGPIAFGALASLYAPRLPSPALASLAFRKQGLPFDSALFEYSRSFVCKPTKVFEKIAPETQADAPKIQIAEVTASITGKQAKQNHAAVAQVTTSTTNAQASATSVSTAPWMTIGLKERTQGVMQIPGSVRKSEKGRELFDTIKAASEEFSGYQKRLSTENRKSIKSRNQVLLEELKQKSVDAKRKVDEGMSQFIKLEPDPAINNPRIVEYISATRAAAGAHAQHQAVDDEINWCASFVSWCLQKGGYKPVATGSDARALDWATYGREAQENEVGAVLVLEMLQGGAGGVRTASGNHVGFLYAMGQDAKKRSTILLLGGNQKYDYEGADGRGDKSPYPRVSITKLTLGVDANIVARRFPTPQDKK